MGDMFVVSCHFCAQAKRGATVIIFSSSCNIHWSEKDMHKSHKTLTFVIPVCAVLDDTLKGHVCLVLEMRTRCPHSSLVCHKLLCESFSSNVAGIPS